MNAHSAETSLLALPLVLLAAAVISVPIARFARLSAIVAYLVAGVVIGPYRARHFQQARNHPHRRRTGRRDAACSSSASSSNSSACSRCGATFSASASRSLCSPPRRSGGACAFDRPVRLARRAGRGIGACTLGNLDRAAHPGRSRPPAAGLRPARLRDPAVPGHVGGAAARARAADGAEQAKRAT